MKKILKDREKNVKKIISFIFIVILIILLIYSKPKLLNNIWAYEYIPRHAPNVYADYINGGSYDIIKVDWYCETDAENTYWAVHNWDGGYCGFQNKDGNHVLLCSLWDLSDGTKPTIEYVYSGSSGEFGGEGTGGQVFTNYDWKIGKWYTMTMKVYTKNGKSYYEQWICEEGGTDIKTAVLSYPVANRTFNSDSMFQEDYTFNNYKRSCRLRNACGRNSISLEWENWTYTIKTTYFPTDPPTWDDVEWNINFDCDWGIGTDYIMLSSGGSDFTENGKVLPIRVNLNGFGVSKGNEQVKFNPNGNEASSKIQSTRVIVNDTIVGIDESKLKYLWTTSKEKPKKTDFIESFANGETIYKRQGSGDWYLWILSYDKVGNYSIKSSNKFVLDNTELEVEVKYSTKEITNGDVTVTLTANEEIQEVEGWKISGDKKKLTKTYTANAIEKVEVYDLAGNKKEVEVKIENIDKLAPEVSVGYSTKNQTKENVIVTLTANEEIEEVEGWTISGDKKKLTKTYTENKTEKVEIYDLVGNKTEVEIKIENIDKTELEIDISNSTIELTNKDVIVILISNKELKEIEGWTLSEDKKKLSKTYTANTIEKVEVYDLVGNKTEVEVKIENIDKIAPIITGVENGKEYNDSVKIKIEEENEVIIVLKKDGDIVTEYSIEDEISETGEYKLTVTDEAGNITEVNFTINTELKLISKKFGITENEKENYISEIQPSETIEGLLEQLNTNASTVIIKKEDKIISEGKLATGMKIFLKLGSQEKTFDIVIRGDVNGDGEANLNDIFRINSHRLKRNDLKGAYLKAGDVNNDGKLELKDMFKINSFRLKKIEEI